MTPSVGEVYDRAIEDGTAYRVYAVGQSTGRVYLQLLIENVPTPWKMEWESNRWTALVEREGLTLRAT